MPRYYFHIDGEKPHSDSTGEELEHDARAWEAAVRTVRDIESGFTPGDQWTLEVHRDRTPVFLISIASRRLS